MSVDVETPSVRQPSQTGDAIRPTSIRRWTGIVLAIGLVVMVVSGLGLFAWHDVPQVQSAPHKQLTRIMQHRYLQVAESCYSPLQNN
jgi:hypothetical protein